MPIYTVHEPPLKRRGSRRRPERFVFIRDGFYFWAFLLTPLWMLYRRLWLVLVGYLLLSGALAFGLPRLGLGGASVFAIQVLLSVLIGLEAGALRRWTLRRHKWREAGLVSADNHEGAERRFFDAWTRDEPATPAPAPAATAAFGAIPVRRPATTAPAVVGLFPEPGAPR